MSLLSVLSELASKLDPNPCLRCRAASRHGLCAECIAEFTQVERPCRCGQPLPCRNCPAADPGWHIGTVFAPFAYEGVIANCIQALKYRDRRRIGAALGHVLADACGDLAGCWDLVVPVPLHRQRLRERRFNQAGEIAAPLAVRLGVSVSNSAVHRRHRTPPQTGQTRQDRLHSLGDAFTASRRLAGKRVLLVDDVITTGATINALASVTLEAGARQVDACAVARAMA